MLRIVKDLANSSVSARVSRIPCLESFLKVCAQVLCVEIVGTDSAGRVLGLALEVPKTQERSQGEV